MRRDRAEEVCPLNQEAGNHKRIAVLASQRACPDSFGKNGIKKRVPISKTDHCIKDIERLELHFLKDDPHYFNIIN